MIKPYNIECVEILLHQELMTYLGIQCLTEVVGSLLFLHLQFVKNHGDDPTWLLQPTLPFPFRPWIRSRCFLARQPG